MKVSYKDLIISPKDTRTVVVSGATQNAKIGYFNKDIASVEFKNLNVSIGQILLVNRQKYKINSIIKTNSGSNDVYELSTGPLTKSSSFIFPMLKGSKELYMYDSLFVNCFISTPKHKDCIALLYRFSGNSEFLQFESKLATFEGFITSSDPSPEYVLFIFKVPKENLEDYTHFRKGAYSKMSDKYKSDILNFHSMSHRSEIGTILYKDPKRRAQMEELLNVKLPLDAELFSIPTLDIETFDATVYI